MSVPAFAPEPVQMFPSIIHFFSLVQLTLGQRFRTQAYSTLLTVALFPSRTPVEATTLAPVHVVHSSLPAATCLRINSACLGCSSKLPKYGPGTRRMSISGHSSTVVEGTIVKWLDPRSTGSLLTPI